MDKKLYREIIDMIPSETVREEIYGGGETLDPAVLLRILYSHAPTFSSLVSFLERIKSAEEGTHAALNAECMIRELEKAKENFYHSDGNHIFELRIRESIYSAEQAFFAKSIDGVRKTVKSFSESYDLSESELPFYRVLKRPIFSDEFGYAVEEVPMTQFVFGSCGELSKIKNAFSVDCNGSFRCDECSEVCIGHVVRYPFFAKYFRKGDIVFQVGDNYTMNLGFCYVVSSKDAVLTVIPLCDVDGENRFFRKSGFIRRDLLASEAVKIGRKGLLPELLLAAEFIDSEFPDEPDNKE